MGKTPHPDWLISLQSLLTTVVIAVFVITFIVQAFQIPSESMENTLGAAGFWIAFCHTARCIAAIS